jgi:hypothetical protein
MKRLALLFFILTACSSQKNSNTGKIIFDTECMGVELDGSQTLKSWGTGRNYPDACEQAKKNAVRDVLFKGIKNGSSDCNSLPLIMNQSVKFDKEDYFNSFFADGGKYSQFVNLKDERILNKLKREKTKNGDQRTHAVVVRVLRSEIQKQLIADGILK